MRSLSLLLQRIAEAFADGQRRPPSRAVGAAVDQYSELLEASIGARMPQEEWSFIKSCAQRHKETLQAAQQNRLGEAHRLAEEAWALARSRSLSVEGNLLIQILLQPVDAYLWYRLEEYDLAREILFQVSAVDHRLVTRYGHVLLSAHRLQLSHNLLRVHVRSGKHGDAVHLGRALLDYVELRADPPSNDLLSAREALDSVPDTVLEHYFDKICGELAILLAGSTDASTLALFQPLAHHADPDRCGRDGFGFHAHAWLRMKRIALRGDVESFLLTATDLLKRGRMSEPPLWFATIIDAADICRSLGREGSRVADDMITKASTLTDAPWILKQAHAHAQEP